MGASFRHRLLHVRWWCKTHPKGSILLLVIVAPFNELFRSAQTGVKIVPTILLHALFSIVVSPTNSMLRRGSDNNTMNCVAVVGVGGSGKNSLCKGK